ncbi:MAG: hypothetical protein JXR69_04395 [Candidatus Delongbacteria bacterium]|nr:hypothetical protein [Candidatus Delongbacteria bacterium]
MSIITLSLLTIVLVLEIIYILFRDPKLNTYNKYILSAAIIVILFTIANALHFYMIVKLVSVVVVLTANVKLKHSPYEKPDYRYLLLLIGAIIINLK